MKTTTIIAGMLAALISTSAFAQSPREDDRVSDRAPATVAKRTTPEEGRKKGSDMSRERFTAWQNKKRQCYIDAGLTEGTEFRALAGGMKFQVNSRVHLDDSPAGQRRSAAVDVCDAL